jgi:uncharacterized protein DUF6232
MKVVLVVLAFVVVASRPLSAQVAGDSVRLRIRPSSTWMHGRFVSLDSSQLFVSQADQNQSYPLQNVSRIEVRRPKHRLATVLGAGLACAAGAALANLVRPDDRKALFGSDGANVAVAGGFGVVVGLINVSVHPFEWRRVRLGVRAGT